MGAERARKPESPAHAPAGKRGAGKASRLLKRCRDFALMLPLAAGIALGGCQKDECRSHNETTYSLKRETDGKTAPLTELLEISGAYPTPEPVLDLLNELHALSSDGIPEDAVITVVAEECLAEYGAVAYAVCNSGFSKPGYTMDRGVYISPETFPPLYDRMKDQISILSHEIGHLQSRHIDEGPGNEVISQLNVYEQFDMGFVLFFRQGEPQTDLAKWLISYDRKLASDIIPHSEARSYGEIPGFQDPDKYRRALLYLFLKLQEHDGDYAKVRDDTYSMFRKRELGDELKRKVREFTSLYSQASFLDLSLSMKAKTFRNYLSRFGPETARAYLDAASLLLDEKLRQLSSGLEGKICYPVGEIEMDAWAPCDDSTCKKNAVEIRPYAEPEQTTLFYQRKISSAKLCCVEMDPGTEEFRKYSILASGDYYYGSLWVGNHTWWGIYSWTSIDSKEPLGDLEPCR